MHQFTYKGLVIVALSDTHGHHREIAIPHCDILIHVGDACQAGDQIQLEDFFIWMSEQCHARYKIFIPGNHDLIFEFYPEAAEKLIPSNILYLQNRIIDIEGIVVAGIEAMPYMLYDTEIDEPLDILLSHGSPRCSYDTLGCDKLLQLINKVKPRFVLFGHIHNPVTRIMMQDGIEFINVSV